MIFWLRFLGQVSHAMILQLRCHQHQIDLMADSGGFHNVASKALGNFPVFHPKGAVMSWLWSGWRSKRPAIKDRFEQHPNTFWGGPAIHKFQPILLSWNLFCFQHLPAYESAFNPYSSLGVTIEGIGGDHFSSQSRVNRLDEIDMIKDKNETCKIQWESKGAPPMPPPKK